MTEPMTVVDWRIGDEFMTEDERQWRVTDVGTRTIIAICINERNTPEEWLKGPPYLVAEEVFDPSEDGMTKVT